MQANSAQCYSRGSVGSAGREGKGEASPDGHDDLGALGSPGMGRETKPKENTGPLCSLDLRTELPPFSRRISPGPARPP